MLRGRSSCELHRVGVFVRLFDHVVHTRIDTVHISGGNVAMGGRNDGVRFDVSSASLFRNVDALLKGELGMRKRWQ